MNDEPLGAGRINLDALYQVIQSRREADPEESYTARLLAKGTKKLAQKVGEEGVETALAAVAEDRAAVIAESADLLYHLAVLWSAREIAPDDVWAELGRRFGTSGLTEKASRKKP
ncbi:phosphoribosyl-ATP diphosphatase [Roseospirillum parvum]|uniref:Phosphoribosyl-ATP pyrophosphatase n=1 Tax=Roseospirillum parvum TaxID=83401 RepID=A0A1G8DQX1_9PROT|nr:phosphoribosyl-ATP diphosphatase [Roseospirillum parvum]SDH60067.1 phosphoribosyl-ATP pyrophosphohydrolase [Roseospirillum parvum]